MEVKKASPSAPAIFMGLLAAVFTYLYFSILSPEMIDKMLASTEAQLQAKNLPQDQIDAGMSMTRKFMKPGIMAAFGLISTVIMGIIVALISAAFIKKDRPPVIIDYNAPTFDATV